MAYTCFESTNMASTHYAKRIFDAIYDAPVENGTFGYLDGLAPDSSVVFNFIPGTKEGREIVVVDQPAWSEDTSRTINQRKDMFRVETGIPFRARVLAMDDTFALSESGFNGTPEVGKYVSIDSNGKLAVSDDVPDGVPMVGQIMSKRTIGSTLVTGIRTYGYERMMYTVQVKQLATEDVIMF